MPFNNSSVEACSAPDWCYFNNETSIDEAGVYPLPLLVIFCFSYAFIFLLGTVGNIVTLTVILKTRYLHNKTNFYLCSLAVSDLLILIFGLPSEVAYLVKNDRFYGGDWLCILRGLLSETATNASVLTVATFTLERWVAICKPFGTNQGSCGRVAGHITLIWLVAVGGAIPLAYQFGVTSYEDPCTCQINHDVSYCSVLKSRKLTYSFEVSSVIFFATPMFLMAVVYVRIVRQLKISFKLLSRPSTLASSPLVLQDTRNRQAIRSKTLVVRMLIVMAVAFFICYSPLHIQRLMTTYLEQEDMDPKSHFFIFVKVIFGISGFLYYLSTTLNPIIYSLLSTKFRSAYNSLFADGKRSRLRNSYPECLEMNKQPGTLTSRRNIQTAYWRRQQQFQQSSRPRRPFRNVYQTDSDSQLVSDDLVSGLLQPDVVEKRRQTWPACPRWCRRSASTNNSTPSHKDTRNGGNNPAVKTVTFILSDKSAMKSTKTGAEERFSV